MTPENTPETTTGPTSGGGEAPVRRRRRVVRDVVTPPAAEPTGTATPPAVEQAATPAPAEAAPQQAAEAAAPGTAPAETAAPEAPASEAPAAPARARRSRRVTRTVVLGETGQEAAADAAQPAAVPAEQAQDAQSTDAPTEVATAEDVTAEDVTAEELTAEDETAAQAQDAPAEPVVEEPQATPAQEPAPAQKPRRSRRRATTVPEVPAEEAGTEEAPAAAAATDDAPAAVAATDEAPADAPAPKTGRRRASRRAASVDDASIDTALATTAASGARPAAQEAGEERPAQQLDVLAELGPVRTPQPTEGGTPPRARLATTAVLFQAPDPSSRPRRRRAQVAAGSPEEISQAAHAPAEDEATVEQPALEEQATVPADEGEGTARSRRRGRGGRGRSRRAADEATESAEDAPSEDEVATDEAAADLDDASADTEQDQDAAADEADQDDEGTPRRRRRRGGRGRRGRAEGGAEGDEPEGEPGDEDAETEPEEGVADDSGDDEAGGSSRRRRRRRRGARAEGSDEPRRSRSSGDEVTALRGSTRLEAKRQRRREGRDAGRRRQIITEAEFLARRESVERSMIVRELHGRTQIGVLEDGVLVEHYVSNQQQASMVGNVYLGRVQNVLPSMEAAFVDVGKGRNAVLYAGEVNWDAVGLEGQPRRIEQALKSGDPVLVQVTKDPIGHKGARLTSQITLAGRYLVYVPGGGMTGISRKLPDTERSRLKKILRDLVPDSAGVIVRTAAEGASEEELRADVARLQGQWEAIEKKARTASAPALLQGEPDMAIRVVRDIFNDDFSSLVVQGDEAWTTISTYVGELAPDLAAKVTKWTGTQDVFSVHRVDEQLAKGMDRKVWLPSGGSLVIDRTEAMTVIDVNTGKFTGAGGTLEETVTRNNLEAAEEIVRQLRLRDIGGIIVIDFIDMVLESNRDLVLRRLVECLGRDRTKHQVAEVTSLGLVQMTRKRVGQGLVEAFSETCEHCHGRGFVVHADPVEKNPRPDAGAPQAAEGESKRSRRKRGNGGGAAEAAPAPAPTVPVLPEAREAVKATLATIAAAAAHAHEHEHRDEDAPAELAAPGAADVLVVEESTVTVTTDVVVEAELPAAEVAPSQEAEPSGDAATDAPVQPTLDVLAELAAAGVAPSGGSADAAQTAPVATEVATAPEAPAAAEPADGEVLELHAVAPEVFAVPEEEDEPEGADEPGADVPGGDVRGDDVPGGDA